MSKNTRWIKQAKSLYFWSFIGWLSVTILIFSISIIQLITEGAVGSAGWGLPVNEPMLIAGPGIIYFYIQSKKLNASNLELSGKIFDRIMMIQKPTGYIAIAGAVLGLIPFLVNFIGVFLMGWGGLWLNIELIFPWISLYGFVTTFIISLRLNKARKSK